MMEIRQTCPACRSGARHILGEWSYSDPALFEFLCSYYHRAKPEHLRQLLDTGRFVVVQCSDCALLYQRDIPDPEFLTEIYERWIIDDDNLAPTANAQPVDYYYYVASEVMHLLAEQRRIVGTGRRLMVLDFGMGWSNWLHVARSLGATVYGCELSAPKVDYARSVGIPVLTLEQIAAMRFDIIAAEQVFEHVSDPAWLLETLVLALADSGFFKIGVPDGRLIESVLKSWRWDTATARRDALMPIHPLEHINCFTRPVLDSFTGRFGLKPAPLGIARAIGHSAGWHSATAIAKNVLRPLWRFGLKRGTYAVYSRR